MKVHMLTMAVIAAKSDAFCVHDPKKKLSNSKQSRRRPEYSNYNHCHSGGKIFSSSLFVGDKIEDDGDDMTNGAQSVNRDRRSFLTGGMAMISTAATTTLSLPPQAAWAGIDVSGLRVEGSGDGNSVLREQLKSIDGSGSARVNQINEMSTASSSSPTSNSVVPNNNAVVNEEELDSTIATWLYRSNPGFSPRLTRVGALGNLYRCEDQVVSPGKGLVGGSSVGITFEFPADWLQLDKFLGGITYVDQRNGDRLYLLKNKLPNGERLSTVPKAFFGTSIFDPKGIIVKSQGIQIDEYKVSAATTIDECPNDSCSTHKRFKIKYSTVTGNGLRVERRALVDAYEMTTDGLVYMIMATSNAVKFEKKDSPERQTVETIVNSFRINV